MLLFAQKEGNFFAELFLRFKGLEANVLEEFGIERGGSLEPIVSFFGSEGPGFFAEEEFTLWAQALDEFLGQCGQLCGGDAGEHVADPYQVEVLGCCRPMRRLVKQVADAGMRGRFSQQRFGGVYGCYAGLEVFCKGSGEKARAAAEVEDKPDFVFFQMQVK